MKTRKASVGPSLNNSVNSVALSQSTAGAANFTLNGALATSGVVTFTVPQRLLITPAGAEQTNGTILTITGTDWSGNVATETIKVANNPSTNVSLYDYSTVTIIASNKATAGNIQVGTNGTGSSRPIYLDEWAPGPTALQVDVTGTVNVTVQQTLDDLNASGGYTAANWISHPDLNLVGLTGNVQGNYAYTPRWVRLLLNSGSGSATLHVLQLDA